MKVLFFGMGSIGQRHARNLRHVFGETVDLIAYRQRGRAEVITPELSIKNGATLEMEYGVRSFQSLEDALAEEPEVAFITNPTHLHLGSAIRAAEAGCHLFIEKPLDASLETLDRLRDLVARKNLVCLVAYQLRFHPALDIMRKALASGMIGEVIAGRQAFGEFMPGWHKYEDYRDYHAGKSDQGGGVLLSQIHDLDFLYALFGMPSRVCCFGGKLSDLEIDVEDTVSVLLEFENASGKKFPIQLHQDYSQRPPQRMCEIIGTSGKITWDYFDASLTIVSHDGRHDQIHRFTDLQRNDLFLGEIHHFFDCIKNGTSPCVDLESGADTVRIALAARESMLNGRIVHFAK